MPDYIDTIISKAYSQRASDIHIDPEFDFISIRFRIDGVVYEIEKMGSHIMIVLLNGEAQHTDRTHLYAIYKYFCMLALVLQCQRI